MNPIRPAFRFRCSLRRFALGLAMIHLAAIGSLSVTAAGPLAEPVVARIEMKLAVDEKVVDVIAKGDLLTVLEEREEDYVILTHDGSKGAVDKVNAVRIAESASIYTDLIQRNPEEGRYYTLRASAWWALGNVEKALDDFNRAIKLGYEEAHAYTSRGLFHAEMGNFDEAIADYDKSLEIDPEAIAPIINRAAVHMSRGDYDKAAADYGLVLEKRENSASILHQRAIALKADGKLDEAVADFDTLLQINPKDRAAAMGRGYIRYQQQDHQAAIEDFSVAIALNKKDAVAFNNRGYNRCQIAQYAEALADYDTAIGLAPKYALALQNRAWLLATATDENVRDPAAAVESAKAACDVTNYTAVGDLSALAAALAAEGKFDEAVGWQEKVVEMVADPYRDFAEKMLDRYQNERPFAPDPDKANAEEREAAEKKAAAEKEAAAKIEADAQQAASESAEQHEPA